MQINLVPSKDVVLDLTIREVAPKPYLEDLIRLLLLGCGDGRFEDPSRLFFKDLATNLRNSLEMYL